METSKVHIVPGEELQLKNPVTLITGGKESFELTFLKYLSPEVLNAAIIGTKLSAPSTSDIYTFFYKLSLNNSGGILAVIPNDLEVVENFKFAKTKSNFCNIEIISIADDCWKSSEYRHHSLAGITFAFNLAGMMKKLMKLPDIYGALKDLKIKTISCHLKKYFSFIGTNLELGTGKFIHTCKLPDLISEMLNTLLACKKVRSLYNTKNLILINCYTSNTILLNNCVEEVSKQLKSRDFNVDRIYFGNFMFGPRGFSISLIDNVNNKILGLADASYSNYIWPVTETSVSKSLSTQTPGPFLGIIDFIKVPARFACEAMMSSEKIFNLLDVKGKFGTLISKPLEILWNETKDNTIPWERPCKVFKAISKIFYDSMQDSHGNLFHLLFLGLSNALSSYPQDVPLIEQMWLEALIYAIEFVKDNAKIQEGEFTFIDVLSPFSTILELRLASVDRYLDEKLSMVLQETNDILSRTYEIESPKKRKSHPEVSSQATFVALISIVQGIRSVMNTIRIPSHNNLPYCEKKFLDCSSIL